MQNDKVSFDPGFFRHTFAFPPEIVDIISSISSIKQMHTRKFEFQKLEVRLLPIIKSSAAVYLGCTLWGCYLHFSYPHSEITGNIMKDAEENTDKAGEIELILATIEQLHRASKYYLNRPFRIDDKITNYFRDYRNFAELNNNFAQIAYTSDIKIPDNYLYFKNYSIEQLDELKDKIYKIIESDKITDILDLVD